MITKFRPKLFIRESNKIEGIKGKREVEQSMKAWKYLETRKKLRHLDIIRIQKVVTQNQTNLLENQRGYYRTVSGVNVTIGKASPPSADKIDDLMKKWLKDLPKMSPLLAHIRFEYIHPFVDGNGRVGRMLYWWHCKQLKSPPAFFTRKKRKRYYRLFEKRRINNLKKNNWGIDFGKGGYEVTIKLKSGKLVRGVWKDKPTEKTIEKNMPKTMKFDSIVKIKKLDND